MNTIWKTDPNYPSLLYPLNRAPAKLYWRGEPLNPKDRYFAIVGTRRPTSYGEKVAEEFASTLARAGFAIVSGLAYGIDSIAHRSALNAGGRTIAVLGSGFDYITPTCNRELAQQIEKNGTLITEFEPSIPPNKTTFPQRNRIIAGMSKATLIVEAPERSGALITARLALEYGREVFAVPGNITQETSKGTNALIRDSRAIPVTDVKDIFDALKVSYQSPRVFSAPPPNLTEEETLVYMALQKSELLVDEIAAHTKLPISQVGTVLSLLELKGLIEICGGYALITR